MSNELVLVLSMIFIYSGVVLSHVILGKEGLLAWTVIATITTNIEVLFLFKAFGMEQTLGNVLFASTFVVSDILNELYGKKEANKAVNVGIIATIIFLLISQSWFLYTPSSNDIYSVHIYKIFSLTPRLMITSFLVYAVVQRFDVYLYSKIWQKTSIKNGKRKMLWLRNNVSTLISQLLNTILFSFGAFLFIYDTNSIVSIIIVSYIIFIITSVCATPFVYLARYLHEKGITLNK